MFLNFVIVVFLVSVFWYLWEIVSFHKSIERNKSFWDELGRPSMFDPNGQAKVIGVILGISKNSLRSSEIFRKQIFRIRVLLFTAIFSFVLMLMIDISAK